VGAEQAGDPNNNIPAWTGGLDTGALAGAHYADPFAADKPIDMVSAANGGRWQAWLTPGTQMRLLSDADLRLPVYPTRRSAADSAEFYAGTRENAMRAGMHDGLPEHISVGIPFPVPDKGMQVIWNHLLRDRPAFGQRTFVQAFVQPNARLLSHTIVQRFANYWPVPVKKHPEEIPLASLLELTIVPQRLAGSVMMLRATLNQASKMWLRDAGALWLAKVTDAAPGTSVLGAAGLMDVDQLDGYLGPPGLYDWSLIGKEARLVPYNAYKLDTDDLNAALTPRHMNADVLRYEIHRTWHVRGTCRAEMSCHFNRRDYWLDEDTWQILLGDLYVADHLAIVQESHPLMAAERHRSVTVLSASFNPKTGEYLVRTGGQYGTADSGPPIDPDEFRPLAARRWAIRELKARNIPDPND
jgi:hypothetical protein